MGGVLLFIAALSILAFLLWRFVQSKGGAGPAAIAAGAYLKTTPLGVPSRALDDGITAMTGREETLGGMLAEWFDPATREFNRQQNDANKGRRAEVENAENPSPFSIAAP